MASNACRFCGAPLEHSFVDLGMSPLCQTQISEEQLDHAETFLPLHAHVCSSCLLVQIGEYVAPDIIFSTDYPYFSSYSTSWLEHARAYAQKMINNLSLGTDSLVYEIASNDGYLLRNFVEASIPVVGIEPAGSVADAARKLGIRTEQLFFGKETAQKMKRTYGNADLIAGNNVLAHVPDINDFVGGMKLLLAEYGTITMEFPHLLELMQHNQFDTIYHEHFSYLSAYSVCEIFSAHGLTVYDIEQLETHGGSLRIFAKHEDAKPDRTRRMQQVLDGERDAGLTEISGYTSFARAVERTKRNILQFLIDAKGANKTVVGYGAPGKGNTLLNYCGIRTDLIDYTVDRNPHKCGTYTPGTRIPIKHPDEIYRTRPDYLFILPWNLKTEIISQTREIVSWGGAWVTPIPDIEIHTG